jgi:hypothetical protein
VCSVSEIDFWGQKLLDTELIVSWSIVMVEDPSLGRSSPHYFHIVSLVDSFTLWNKFKVNNALEIGESDEHYLHL